MLAGFLTGDKTASHYTMGRFLFAWDIENSKIKLPAARVPRSKTVHEG